VLGVDDLALRRRHTDATILIDRETHRPIDLLEGRDVETLAAWLRDHPGVKIIVRDPAEAYANVVRQGAPDVLQVADRFQLVQTVSNALDELLKTRRRRIAVTVTEPAPPPGDPRPLSPRQQQIHDRRTARVARWEEVRRRHATGERLQSSARAMGFNRHTVTWMARRDVPPLPYRRPQRPASFSSPSLQPHISYLPDRWQDGCINISQLYQEISARGYVGSRSLLSQALQPWRAAQPAPPHRTRTRQRSIRWLYLRPAEDLKPEEGLALDQVVAEDDALATGHQLLQRF